MKEHSKLNNTRYKGYYIDIRDGKRVGIYFTYLHRGNNNPASDGSFMYNEKEIKITELKY